MDQLLTQDTVQTLIPSLTDIPESPSPHEINELVSITGAPEFISIGAKDSLICIGNLHPKIHVQEERSQQMKEPSLG